LASERSEASQNYFQFPTWRGILELVKIHFSVCGGEESLSQKLGKAAEPHRSKPQKEPGKNVGSNHVLTLGKKIF